MRFIAETVRSVVQARKTYAERNLMRRPLFTVCLCLVTIIAIMRILAGVGTGEDTGLPPDGSPVKITGRIDTRSSEEIILKSISIIQNDQEYSYSGKLQCELENMKTAMITAGAVTEEEKTLKIGQQIALEGTFVLFSTATNPGEFDAQAYYAAKGIGGRVRKAQILAAGEKYSFLREKLYGFRQVLHDRLAEVFPAKEASVMQTLLLGEKEELDAEVKALYQKNGIAHILSISGVKTLKLDIPLVPEPRINWAFVPLHIAIIYILKLCLDEEIIPRCRFPCSRGYLIKCINWQKKQSFSVRLILWQKSKNWQKEKMNMAYKKYREMKVYEASGYQYKRTPSIVLKGKWLSDLGFDIGEQIEVKCEDGRLVITKANEIWMTE